MEPKDAMRKNISDESLAYGFTMSVWGSGAILLANSPEINPLSVLSFGMGSIISFALISEIVFSSLLTEYEIQGKQKRVVASMIHLLGAGVNIAFTYTVVQVTSFQRQWILFFTIGFSVMLVYNLMLLVEIYGSEKLLELRNKRKSGHKENPADH